MLNGSTVFADECSCRPQFLIGVNNSKVALKTGRGPGASEAIGSFIFGIYRMGNGAKCVQKN